MVAGYNRSMSLPILYSFRRCPYAMRARLAIVTSGVQVELREVVLAAKPAMMLDASPKATVPVLVLPDGSVIDESLDIMRWAFASEPPGRHPSDVGAALIATNDGAFKYHLDRYKYADRYGVEPTEHRRVATTCLQNLDERLRGDGRLDGDGDSVSMTDLAILPFVRQFAATDQFYFDALAFDALHAWLDRHLSSAMFAAIMPRLAAWNPGDTAIVFPSDPTVPA